MQDALGIVLSGPITDQTVTELDRVLNMKEYAFATMVVLQLNSAGGFIQPSFRAHQLLVESGRDVLTHNMGRTDSAALMLYLAGTFRTTALHATFQFHEVGRRLAGRDPILRASIAEEIATTTRMETNQLADIIEATTAIPRTRITQLLKTQAKLDANKAIRIGLAHHIALAVYDLPVGVEIRG